MPKNYENKLETISTELISASDKLNILEISKIRNSPSTNNGLAEKIQQAKAELIEAIKSFDEYSKSAKDINAQDLRVVANYVNSLRNNI